MTESPSPDLDDETTLEALAEVVASKPDADQYTEYVDQPDQDA